MASLAPKNDQPKKRKALGKVWAKVKTALSKGDSSKAKAPPVTEPLLTTAPQPSPEAPGPDAAGLVAAPSLPPFSPTAAITPPPPLAATAETPPPPPAAAAAIPPHSQQRSAISQRAEARARHESMEGVTKLARTQLFQERAQKLAERYGLDINVSDWIRNTTAPDDTVLRVDKPIRIRIRRTCHQCNTALSQAKECPSCHHPRCPQCPRYPPKRSETETVANRERRAARIQANKDRRPPIIPDWSFTDRGLELKKPSKTGGQDLYRRKPRQRVRRTCHECQALFVAGRKKCQDCAHTRCTDCPRDPPKKDKYPFGYPGDVFGPNSVPHFECRRCESLYPVYAEDGTACSKCGLPKSDSSPRALPRKVEPQPDPEILKRLQARLDMLKVA